MLLNLKNSMAVLLCMSFAVPVSARSGAAGAPVYVDAASPSTSLDAAYELASAAPAGSAAEPGAAGANPWAEPYPAAPAPVAAPSPAGAAPSMWEWQGSDDIPVPEAKSRQRRQAAFNPQSDTGMGMHLNGTADLGYSSESENNFDSTAPPRYSNFDGSFSMDLNGFVYSPGFVSYDLSTSYDHNDLTYGDRGATTNGLTYAARVGMLQATAAPFAVSYQEINSQTDGSLITPFNFNSRAVDIAGNLNFLPVGVTYRLSEGSSDNNQATSYDLDYHYHSGDVYVTRQLLGFRIQLGDDYNDSDTFAVGETTTQTTNYVRLNVNRNLGSNANLFMDGDWSKYKFGEPGQGSSSDSDVTTFGGGVQWHITRRLDTTASDMFAHNSINLFQLLSQSTATSVLNPVPSASTADTHTNTFSSSTNYRPDPHWSFGTVTSYTSANLPPSLINSVPEQLTSGTFSEIVSAGYAHPVWKFVYNGAASGGIQSYTNQVTEEGSSQNGNGKIYSVSSGITGGDDHQLRYGVQFTMDQSNNPVFFTLLTSDDRLLDFNFGSRRLRFVRLNANVEYSQRSITYQGSTQNVNGLNFMVSGNCSRLDLMAGRTTSNSLENIFSYLSTASGSGSPLTNLPVPQLYSNSTNEFFAETWRALHNLRINSQYTRFAFTVTGQIGQNRETWWDSYAQYGFGRFDIIGGYVRSTGYTSSSNLRDNRIYFRIKFPFHIM